MLYVTIIVLTVANVRCAVLNTRKMANWMMNCMMRELHDEREGSLHS